MQKKMMMYRGKKSYFNIGDQKLVKAIRDLTYDSVRLYNREKYETKSFSLDVDTPNLYTKYYGKQRLFIVH